MPKQSRNNRRPLTAVQKRIIAKKGGVNTEKQRREAWAFNQALYGNSKGKMAKQQTDPHDSPLVRAAMAMGAQVISDDPESPPWDEKENKTMPPRTNRSNTGTKTRRTAKAAPKAQEPEVEEPEEDETGDEEESQGERGFSQLQLIGRIGSMNGMRYTPDGTAVADFRLAINHRDGTDWFTINAWDRLAEFVNEYLEVGRRVFVQGRFWTREWTDNQGDTRTSLEVRAFTIQFADSRPADDE